MASSRSFPTPSEFEAAEALLLLAKQQPFVWGSKKRRSIPCKLESGSKISTKEKIEDKTMATITSPSTPLAFHSVSDDPPHPLSVVGPKSDLSKLCGDILKEQKEKIAVLVDDKSNLGKGNEYVVLKVKTMFSSLEEMGTWLREAAAAARKRSKGLTVFRVG